MRDNVSDTDLQIAGQAHFTIVHVNDASSLNLESTARKLQMATGTERLKSPSTIDDFARPRQLATARLARWAVLNDGTLSNLRLFGR